MFLMRTISSCFSSSMTRRFLVASRSEPPRISASMRATRRGVALMPGRRTSSPTPSRTSVMPFSIFLMSMVVPPPAPLALLMELADGLVGDLLERRPGLAGRLEQVLVFRLDVDRPPLQEGQLEADLLAANPDGPALALEDAATDRIEADPDRGRLPEHGFDQGVHTGAFDEERELRPKAVLLHDDGGEGGVQRAFLEGPLEEAVSYTHLTLPTNRE